MPTALDPKHIHRAHCVGLTSTFTAGYPVGPIVAAQCTGRIGWGYETFTHPFVELYRGNDYAEAQRACDEHNNEHHPKES